MTTPISLAEKQVAKLQIEGKTYYRIFHYLHGKILGITILELGEEPNKKELYIQEVAVEGVSESIRPRLFFQNHTIPMTDDDKSLITQTLQMKYQLIKTIAEKKLNRKQKRKLMACIEVGGHYFGYVYEEGMPYTKLYQLVVDVEKDELYVGGITPQVLPALLEAIVPTILKQKDSITIQVDEGVYVRISRRNKKEALVIVVVAMEKDKTSSKLQVGNAFWLQKEKEKENRWIASPITNVNPIISNEVSKSFEVVYQELLLKVFEQKGNEAFEGIVEDEKSSG